MADPQDRLAAGPGPEALAAFGLRGRPAHLTGGQARSWRVGHAVLKPLDLPAPHLACQADVLTRLADRDDLRVSVPLRTVDGRWSSRGWTAWRFQPGEHLSRRWQDIVEVGRRLHAALRDEPEPPFLSQRTDPWAVADRVAWGELPADDADGIGHLARLVAARGPVACRAQLVHGDLTGNVLFHPHLPPLVIDLSPYWRPPEFASAVVVADAIVFEGAGHDVVQPMLPDPTFPQHLLRALIFRIVADQRAGPRPRTADHYRNAVDLAVELSR